MMMMTQKVFIEGMTCNHCAKHVEDALKEIDGIQSVKVDLKGKFAVIESAKSVDDASIKAAIEDAGYELVRIE